MVSKSRRGSKIEFYLHFLDVLLPVSNIVGMSQGLNRLFLMAFGCFLNQEKARFILHHLVRVPLVLQGLA